VKINDTTKDSTKATQGNMHKRFVLKSINIITFYIRFTRTYAEIPEIPDSFIKKTKRAVSENTGLRHGDLGMRMNGTLDNEVHLRQFWFFILIFLLVVFYVLFQKKIPGEIEAHLRCPVARRVMTLTLPSFRFLDLTIFFLKYDDFSFA